MNERPNWIVGAIAAVLVLGVVGVVVMVTRGGEATLVVSSVPDDLRLTLDGKVIAQNGETTIREGKHTLTASRSGFEAKAETFSVREGETARFAFYLSANGPEGRQWYREHPDAEREKEGEGSRRFDETSRENTENYPMVRQLPYIGPSFRIDYGVSKAHPRDASKVGIYVKEFSPGGRVKALDWMRQNGYDPAHYEIIYVTE
jgi:PEGA domain